MNETTFAMIFALAGWLACSYGVKHSKLSARWQRLTIIPLWFAWLALALGGPVFNGSMPLTEAIASGAACTIGMTSFLFVTAFRAYRSSR